VVVFVECRPPLLVTVSPIEITAYRFAATEADWRSAFSTVSSNYLRLRISTEPSFYILVADGRV